MSDISVRITNDNTKEVKKEIEKALDLAFEDCGSEAERYAKYLCPTDTSLLKNSITYAVHGKEVASPTYTADKPDRGGNIKSGSYSGSAPNEEICVFVGSNVSYAAYVEMGTSNPKYPRQPFLKPAVQDHKDKYKEIIEEHLKNA